MNANSRTVLSHFLKSRRARLRPQDVGLPSGRRRVAGLRREEVAALAGLGDTWYGLLESGKDIRVSEHVIDSVGSALRLSADERRYFASLTLGAGPDDVDYPADPVAPQVLQTLAAITSAPAFVIGPRLDYLAMNAVTRALYAVADPPLNFHCNMMLRVFFDPYARRLYPDWSETAARAVTKFRRNYGMHVGNASFEALIAELNGKSDEFRRLWERHDVGTLHDEISDALQHPAVGRYAYRLQAYAVPDSHTQSLVIMLPRSAADEAAVAGLLAYSAT